MLEYVLVLMIVSGGGSPARPTAVSIDSINFKSQESCAIALNKAVNTRLPDVGSNFKMTGFCTQNL